MNQRTTRAVLFDWDGTLVDSAEPTYRVYVRLFADYGIAFDRQTFARTYSPAWHNTYRDLGLHQDRWAEADERWLQYFGEETTNLIADAAQALQALTERGVVCGIVTSGTRSRIQRELVNLGVHHHFSQVVCGDDGHAHKPHPEALAVCLDKLQIQPADAVYVGDTAEDMMMARAAGVFSVGVCGPYPNHDSLRAAAPDLMAESLTAAVRRLFA
jgi:HAD superfamily hydrolase (TIGR01549 family)